MFGTENNVICVTFRETERGSVVSKSYKRMQNKGLDCDLYVSSVVLYQERKEVKRRGEESSLFIAGM